MTTKTNEKVLLWSEDRFKRTCKMACDLSIYPTRDKKSSVATNKVKSKEFSEVFTPIWLVDEMIDQVEFDHCDTATLDLCAGYGQFSIRLMRMFNDRFSHWDVRKFIRDNHAFSELQLSSCYKLLNIFSNEITLFIGDSTKLNKLPANAKGLWCYIEEYGYWACLTQTIKDILSPNGIKEKSCSEAEFVSLLELIIKGLNEKYKIMYELTLKQLTSPQIRLELISQASKASANDSLQHVDTPVSIVDEMLDKVEDLEKKSILVLFNCEIVERLICKKKIDPSKITFGVEFAASLKSDLMKKMYGVDTINFSKELGFIHNTFKGRKFDVVFSNPPYNAGIDLKIIQALIGGNIAEQYVLVHPSTWLIDQKNKDNLYSALKIKLNLHVRSIKLFNGNAIFGIQLFVPCIINHIDFNYTGSIHVDDFGESYAIDSIYDITKFGQNWLKIVKPFKMKLSSYDNIWDHRMKIEGTKPCCQLSRIRGNISVTSNTNNKMVSDDFYTTVMSDCIKNKGIRKALSNRGGPSFEFNTNIELDNFLNYLKTDFARFSFSLLKNKADTDCGEMTTIPWLDFTQAWDDEKLFKHFDVNKETQDYIRKFLPDYYGIRK